MSADSLLTETHDLRDPARPLINVDGNWHRLGCLPPRPDVPVLRLSYYFDAAKLAAFAATVPDVMDFTKNASLSLNRMYGNDRYGDCVIASKYHKIGMASAMKGADCRVGDDSEVISQYHAICGSGDNGCVITDVLDAMVAGRFNVGGKVAKLDGYCFVEPTNWDLQKVSHYLFGPHDLGLNLPSDWEGNNQVWDIPKGRSVGGHDVQTAIFDYTNGISISSWAKIYRITKPAYTLGDKWVQQSYATLDLDWYGPDKLSPTGIKYDDLVTDLALIKQGRIPEINPAALHYFADLV